MDKNREEVWGALGRKGAETYGHLGEELLRGTSSASAPAPVFGSRQEARVIGGRQLGG